ncbi:MAG: hypothetical protein U0235_20200 [Polyangiaceae bacterium]
MSSRAARTSSLVLLSLLAGACRARERGTGEVDASSLAPAPLVTSASAAPPSSSAPDAALDAPDARARAPLAAPAAPDVRVEIPAATKSGATLKADVAVGQTFGVLLATPAPDDWMDSWELVGCSFDVPATRCALGEPITIASREPEVGQPQAVPPTLRSETIWRLSPAQIGARRLEARYVHRKTRTDPGTTTKRIAIEIAVRP